MYFDSQNVNGNLQAESYSSQGGLGAAGIPYYFDTSGNLLPNAPVLRSAPDLMAPDGCTTSSPPPRTPRAPEAWAAPATPLASHELLLFHSPERFRCQAKLRGGPGRVCLPRNPQADGADRAD
jgi:hypothetical protein